MFNPFAKKPTPIREFANPFAAFLAAQADIESAAIKGQKAERYVTTFDGFAWLVSDRVPVVRTRTTHVYHVTAGAQAEEVLPAVAI